MTLSKSKLKIIENQVDTTGGLLAGRFSPTPREVGTHGLPYSRLGENPLCPASALSEYVQEAKNLFGHKEWQEVNLTEKDRSKIAKKAAADFGIDWDEIASVSSCLYGFIEVSDNLHKNIDTEYGFSELYYKRKKGKNIERNKSIRSLRPTDRLRMFNMGLIEEYEIYEAFETVVYEQNEMGITVYNQESGEKKTFYTGRFCNKKGIRSRAIEKALKEGIGEITDCIMLTLGVHEDELIKFMSGNINLTPVMWATCNIGKMVNGFLKRFRRYQDYRGLPWEYVGYVVEFQSGDKKVSPIDRNGFPHIHMIFRGHWIGKIHEIAKLWPYCPVNGVDYSDKKKVEKRMIAEGKLRPGRHISGINLVKYMCAYVGKNKNAVDKEKGVHKGYAWMWFAGVREFNVSPRYRAEKKITGESEKVQKLFSRKAPVARGEIDHVCDSCGLVIYKDSFQIMSHLCIPEKKYLTEKEVNAIK